MEQRVHVQQIVRSVLLTLNIAPDPGEVDRRSASQHQIWRMYIHTYNALSTLTIAENPQNDPGSVQAIRSGGGRAIQAEHL